MKAGVGDRGPGVGGQGAASPSRACARAGAVLLLLGLGLLAACGGAKKQSPVAAQGGRGVHHVVKAGETLYRIGKAYGVTWTELARVNGIDDPSRIEVGQRLYIPNARRQLPVDVITPRDASSRRRTDDPKLPPDERPFAWPIEGAVTSGFGPRGQSFHDGIDIAAEVGTPVYAAADGVVAYADELRGYGNVVIIRHEDDYATVYAHNDRNLVREGQSVSRGAKIATVGESGRTSAPNLHFEVRLQNTARNPIYYLPPSQVVQAKASR